MNSNVNYVELTPKTICAHRAMILDEGREEKDDDNFSLYDFIYSLEFVFFCTKFVYLYVNR